MQLLVEGNAPKVVQPAEGATYEPIMKKDLAQVMYSTSNTWSQVALTLNTW